MLQKMRSGAQSVVIKVVLFGLLMLAMLGLAFTDVQGMFRAGGTSGATTVAKIGRDKISAAELDVLVQRNLRQPAIANDESMRRAVPGLTLNQEVTSRVHVRAAHDLGLILDNKTAAAILKKDVLGPVAASAGITEKQALQGMLRNAGMSEHAFVNAFKNQVASDQLTRIISAPAQAPEQMVTDALKRRYEWRRGEYFELTAADLGDALKTPPTDEELKSYYESIAGSFLLPEYRDFNVLVISREALGLADSKPSETDIAAYYDENKDHFGEPEERRIEQLIAPDRETAEKLLADAKAGNSLAELGKKAKANATTANVIFAASTYRKDEMDIELADPAFGAEANTLVGPVQTPLGWHVMKIAEVMPARTPPLATVRAEIEKEMMEERGADALYARATEIDDQVANGQSLSDIAAQLQIKPQSFKGVTSEGTDKTGKAVKSDIATFNKIVETAFTLDQGQVSPLAETSDGNFLLIETTNITPAQEQPFEAVRTEVTDSLRLKTMGELFDQRSAEITEKMQLGESFEAVAKRLGKRVSSTPLLQRTSTPAQAGIERGMLPALFSLDSVGQTTAVSGNEKVTILRLAERKIDAPREAKKADGDALRATLTDAMRNDILEQYRTHLFQEYNVSINEDAVARLYAPNNDPDSVE